MAESTFLDIFLLNGLAELALAEGDIPRAGATFAEALRRLHQPGTDVLATIGIPDYSVRLAIPPAERALVDERRTRSYGGLAAADLELLRRRNAAPGSLPVAGLVADDGTEQALHASGGVLPVTHGLGPVAGRLVPEHGAGTGAPASATPTSDRMPGALTGAMTPPTSATVGDRVLIPSILAGIAKVAASVDAHEPAARLFGAAENLRGFTTMLHRQGRWILFEHLYRDRVSRCRNAIGDPAFQAAFQDGQAMPAEAAVEYAILTLNAILSTMTGPGSETDLV
jgi:hypothetical protein